jgi:hypothetical protein
MPWPVKERGIFTNFTTKERLNFPAANHHHVDSIAHANF